MKTHDLIDKIKAKFVNLPGEELILVERKHWSTFVMPLALLVIIGAIASAGIIIASSFLTDYIFLLIPALLLTISFILSLAVRSIIDWYFNLYIVTNRKIMELSYIPLSSHQTNSILLDQVKCTEIDTKIEGLINDLLDIGHVVITFDRPTHKEAFILEHLHNPEKVESYLQDALYPNLTGPAEFQLSPPNYTKNGLYNKIKNSPGKWTYIEDIVPLRGAAG